MKNCALSVLRVMIINLSVSVTTCAQGYQYADQALTEKTKQSEALTVHSSTIIDRVKNRHEEELMNVKGVVGVGIGRCDEEDCIKVLVVEKTPEIVQSLPHEIEGIKVSIEQTGQINTLPTQ